MALLFHALGMSERRAHELSGMNAENAHTRRAAFSSVANKAAVAGKQHAIPTDVLAWHKSVADDATKAGKKRPAPAKFTRRFSKAPRSDALPRPPRQDQ